MKHALISHLKITIFSLLLNTSAQAFELYTTGNPNDVQRPTQPMTCLAGGGDDDLWSEGWRHMLLKANGGDVLIIRADNRRGGYEDWIFNDPDAHNFPKVNSVNTLLLNKEDDGNQADVEGLIKNAEMIFFAGGDQWEYLRIIKGTRMESALNFALHIKKIPFGGTSAGMAILGDMDFSARYDTVTAEEVMKDPTGKTVDLDRGFLLPEFMEQVITDTHFSQRNRQGRLVGFMAKAVYDKYSDALNIRGIGADEDTAICYGQSGQARVFGAHRAYFLSGNAPIERIEAGSSLNWLNQGQAVKVYALAGSLGASAYFDLTTWSGSGGETYYWAVDGTDKANPVFVQMDVQPKSMPAHR